MGPQPCEECGVDSVATCLVCHRRVCNRHMVLAVQIMDLDTPYKTLGADAAIRGAAWLVHPTDTSHTQLVGSQAYRSAFVGGNPRCLRCRTEDAIAADEPYREERARRAQAARDATSALTSAAEPVELARAIMAAPGSVEAAWKRLTAMPQVNAPWQVAESSSRKSLFGPRVRQIGRRLPAWHAPACLRRGSYGSDGDTEWTEDAFITADLDVWTSRRLGDHTYLQIHANGDRYLALRRGDPSDSLT